MFAALARRLLGMSAVGIALSERAARLCRLDSSGSGTHALTLGEVLLPEGALVGGDVCQPAVLALALRVWLDSPAGRPFRNRPCRSALPAEQSFIHTVELPALAPRDIPYAIRWETEGALPLPADDLVYRYELAPTGGSSIPRRAVITAFPRRLIAGYRRAFNFAGIRPVGFELESQATVRALAPASASDPAAIVEVDGRQAKIAIAEGRSVQMVRGVPVGHLRDEASGDTIERLASELRRILWSHRDHPAARYAGLVDSLSVYLSAEGDPAAVARALGASLGRPVSAADPLSNLKLAPGAIPPVPRGELSRYATAIGLAIT